MEKFSPRDKKRLWLVVPRWAPSAVARLKFCYGVRVYIWLHMGRLSYGDPKPHMFFFPRAGRASERRPFVGGVWDKITYGELIYEDFKPHMFFSWGGLGQ